MSKTIDERIVSMQFDNKNFESNVQTSMSTLDKLKQKLHLPGASKGLEEVANSAKKVDLNPIGKAADAVQVKFTAMQTIADQALRNITNSAMNAGKKMLSALTIDPVKDGFNEYELTMNAIQTTMAGTGKTAKEVEKELEKLDAYADKTVYSTADMLNNLPKFTNAGVELGVATEAMIGIANATAHAGGDANKASIAFYNLGQAIGTGYLSRMDYNSINNAGIATMEWKNQMVDAAIAAGTLKKVGEDSYQAGNKTLTLQQLFIEGLQEQWATTDVMLKVFGDYGNETTEIGKKAYESATKIKTFSMMMESLKATAGTGWKNTWQIIFGGLDEATELWTGIYNFLSGIITKFNDWRNAILDTALAKTFRGIADSLNTVLKPVNAVKDALVDYDKLADEIIAGKWKNAPTRWQDLAAAGYDWAHAQNIVNERLGSSVRHATDYTEGQKEAAKATGELTEAQANNLIELAKLSDAELEKLGWDKKQIEALRQLQKEADKLGVSFEFFIKNLDKINGRWALIEAFKNLGKALSKVFGAIKDAWKEVFDPITGEGLYNAIAAFHKFTKALEVSDETADKLKRTFRGVFAVLSLVKSITGATFKIIWAVIKGIMEALGYVNIDILGFTAIIGDAIYAVQQWVKEHDVLIKVVSKTVAVIMKLFVAVFKLLQKLWLLPPVQKVVDSIAKAFDKMKNSAKGAAKSFGGWLENIDDISFEDVKNAFEKFIKFMKNAAKNINESFGGVPGHIISGLANGLGKGAKKVWDVVSNLAQGIADWFCKILRIESPSKVFIAIGGFIIAGLIGGLLGGESTLGGAATGLVENIKGIFGSIDWGTLIAGGAGIGLIGTAAKIAGVLNNITAPLAGVGSVLEGTGEVLSKSARAIKKTIKNFAKIENAVKKAINAKAWQMRAEAIKTLAVAIAILVASVVVLTLIDVGKLWASIGALAAIAVILGIVAIAITKFGGSVSVFSSLNLLGMSASIVLFCVSLIGIVLAIGVLALIPAEALNKSLDAFVTIVVSMSLLVAVMALCLKGGGPTTALSFGVLVMAIGAAMMKLALVILILGMLSTNTLTQGLLAVGALGALILGLIWATSLAGGEDKVKSIGKTIKQIGTALLIMSLTVAILGNLENSTIVRGLIAIGSLGALIVGLIWATNLAGGEDKVKSIGKTIKQIGVALLIMTATVAILGNLDTATIIKGTLAITALGAVVVGLIWATRLAGGETKGMISSLFGISFAMLILAGVSVILGLIPTDKLWKGIAAVAALTVLMIGLIAACKMANNITGTIIGLAVCIGLLVTTVLIFAYLNPKKALVGIAAMTTIVGMLSVLMLSAKGIDASWSTFAMIAALGATMVGLAIVMVQLAKLPLKGLLGSAIALSLVMLTMSGVLILLGKQSKTINKATKAAGAMALLGVALVAMAISLKMVGNCQNSIEAAIALSALLVAMTGVLKTLGKNQKYMKKANAGVWALLKLAVPLAAFAIVLVGMSYAKNAIESATALSELAIVMTGVLFALSKMGSAAKISGKTLLSLTALAIPLAAFVGVLFLMNYVENAKENADALAKLMLTLSGALLIIGIVGMLAFGLTAGIIALTALAIPMLAFIGIIALMSGIKKAEENVMLLCNLMNVLADLMLKLAIAGPLALVGVTALTMLTTLMVAMTVFAVAIGALMEWIPSLRTFLTTGISVMVELAGGIGEMISAFLSGLLSRLPEMGIMLSQFALNATPFFAMAAMVGANPAIMDGVGYMTSAILLLTVANFIDGVLSLLSFQGFDELGTKLSNFATSAQPFFDIAKTIDPAVMAGIKTLSEAILILTGSNLLDGIASFITGESSLSKFGGELTLLGEGLRGFMDALGIMDESQVKSVDCACKAIKMLAQAAEAIPNEGGLWAKIAGDNSLASFSGQFGTAAEGINGFVTTLADFGDDKIPVVECACKAIKLLSEAAGEIPNEGGLWAAIAGDNSLATFSGQLDNAAEGINGFVGALEMEAFGEDKIPIIECACEAIKKLSEAAGKIPNEGGVWGWLAGDNSLAEFAGNLPKVAKGINGFVKNLSEVSTEKVDTINTAIEIVAATANLAKHAENISKGGKNLGEFSKKINTFTKTLKDISTETLDASIGKVNKLVDMCKSISSVDYSNLKSFGSSMSTLGGDIKKGFIDKLKGSETIADVKDAMNTMIKAATDAAEAKKKDAKSKMKSVAEAAVKELDSKAIKDSAKSAGKSVVDGFAEGIKANTFKAEAKAKAMAKAAYEAAKEQLDVNSPSKIFRSLGYSVPEGFALGIERMGGMVNASATGMADTAIDTVKRSIARIASGVFSDVDSQPTIRPVLDLSDVTSGASAISGLFNDPSLGLSANLNSISASMNNRQNGGSDVVSAIESLRKDLGNVGGTSYTINGVNYSGESDVAEAIKVITRAATMNRRI